VNDTICFGSSTVLHATGALTFAWAMDPTLSVISSASPTASPTVTTMYTVTGTDANGCVASDNITLVVPPTFTVTLSADSATCFSACDGAINLTVASGSTAFDPYTYTWSNGASTQNLSGLCAGNYNVTVKNTATCSQTVSATVFQPASAVVVSQTNNTPVTCNGYSDGSIAVAASGGTPSYVYSFDGGAFSTITSASGLSAGTHIISARDANGCLSSVLSLNVTQPLVVHIAPPTVSSVTLCVGQSTALSATATGGNGGYMYTWNDGVNPQVTSSSPITVTPTTSPLNYTVTAVDVTSCPSDNQEVIVVNLNSPLDMNSIVPNGGRICESKDIGVSVSGQGGNNVYNYTWAPMTGVTFVVSDGSSVKLSPPASTVYTVTIHDACGSPTDTVHYNLTVNPIPTLTVTPATTSGCAPLPVQFTGTSSPASAQCKWTFGEGGVSTSCNTSYNFVLDGNYLVTYSVVDINGCENSKTANVIVFPVPNAAFIASPQPTTVIDPAITFTDITDANVAEHTWFFNDSLGTNSNQQIASYTYPEAGTYPVTLAVITDKGCVDTVTQYVTINEEFVVYVPNSFSPDGDDINEEFYATGTGINSIEMTIFDRWGGVIFNTAEIGKGWNGRDGSDKKVEKGVYIYKLVVINYLGEKKLYTGHLTLVR
ncbi:MAG TPA: PKD domain-containing protein, partial [Bacteroidia bacterium]